jgi:hypothetical protein
LLHQIEIATLEVKHRGIFSGWNKSCEPSNGKKAARAGGLEKN